MTSRTKKIRRRLRKIRRIHRLDIPSLGRLNPIEVFENFDDRTKISARWFGVRAALNPRLDSEAVSSMYNVYYFQYAIHLAEQRGRMKAADYFESLTRYVSAEEAVTSLRSSAQYMEKEYRQHWKNKSPLYYPHRHDDDDDNDNC